MSDVAQPERAHEPAAETRSHELNELSFKLPAALSDKTVHVFALKDDGPNEFNLVISRAAVTAEDTLDGFVDRLTSELARALPRFRLEQRLAAQIGQSRAVELQYRWNNNGSVMQQRQTVALVQSASTDGPEVLMMAGTCIDEFSTKWRAAYDDVLSSMVLRRPWPPAGALASPEMGSSGAQDAAKPARHGFALARDGTLHVVQAVSDLYGLIEAQPLAPRNWKFYRHNGRPLELRPRDAFAPARTLEGGSGPFELVQASPTSGLGPLQHRLATVDRVLGELNDLASVHAHITGWERAGLEGGDMEGDAIA